MGLFPLWAMDTQPDKITAAVTISTASSTRLLVINFLIPYRKDQQIIVIIKQEILKAKQRSAEPPTNTDSSVFIRILKLIRDEKLKNTDGWRARYAENWINIKQRGRGPIILRKYMRKYGRIGASYTDDLRRRLEALEVYL